MTGNDLETLVERIYAAALDRNNWPQILSRIGDLLGGAGGIITIQAIQEGKEGWERSARLDPECTALFRKQYARHPTLRVCSPGSVDEPMPAEMKLPATALSRRPLYGIYLNLMTHPSYMATLGFMRSAPKRLYTPEELALLRRLAPHLRQSLLIDQKLETAKIKLDSLEALLNGLSTATILLDTTMRLLYANTAAETLLARKDGLCLRDQRLIACRRDSHTALLGALCKAAPPFSPHSDKHTTTTVSIQRPSGRRSYRVLLVPSPCCSPSTAWPAAEPAVMLFISDPEIDSCLKSEALQILYGLTPTEVHVTTLLASGQKLEEIAETLHISLNTAKTHLKNVFSKTGTCRQAELVQLYFTALGGTTSP